MLLNPTLAMDLPDFSGIFYLKKFFPYFVQPKYDGVRILLNKSGAYSRTKTLFNNVHLQDEVRSVFRASLDVLDGELIIPSKPGRNHASSFVNSFSSVEDFQIIVFDNQRRLTNEYTKRYAYVQEAVHMLNVDWLKAIEIVHKIDSENYIFDGQTKRIIKQLCSTYEGVILRSNMTYLTERSTPARPCLLRIVNTVEDNPVIIGFTEKMTNTNTAETDKTGKQKRSSAQAGLVGLNTLGSLRVVSDAGIIYSVASGLSDKLAKRIWENQDFYRDKRIVVQHKGILKKKPQHPVFMQFVDPGENK